jgi:tetratricopeptide (TPR) repeat protein
MAVNQAVSLDPNLPSAYRLEAAVLANLGQKSAAIAAAQQALAIDKSLDSGTVSYQQYISEDQQMITYVTTAVPPVYVQP